MISLLCHPYYSLDKIENKNRKKIGYQLMIAYMQIETKQTKYDINYSQIKI